MILGDILRRLFGIKKLKSLEELRAYIKTGDVRHLADWIEWRVDYTKDKSPEEEWQPAEVTIKRGKGDCEDVAVIGWEVIRTWPHWRAGLVRVEKPDTTKPSGISAHALCTFVAPNGERGVIEGTPRIFPKDTAWGWIFDSVGGWDKAYWVDAKGKRLNIVGWEK